MPRKKKSPALDTNRLQEIAEKPMSDLMAHHQAARDFADPGYVELPEGEALDIRLALSEIIRGQKYIGSELSQLRGRMDKYETAATEWKNDAKSFQQSVLARSEKLKASGETKEKIQAKGRAQLAKAITNAKANNVSNRLKFEQDIAKMRKVTVTAPGHTELSSIGGQAQAKLVPDVILIKHMRWVLYPGVPTEVPLIVAQRWDEIRLSREETEARKAVLAGGTRQDTDVAARMQAISQRYGSPSEAFPIASQG